MRALWTGRDGRRVEEQGWKVDDAIKEFILDKTCRWIALDKEMDGRTDRLGCEIGEERCDMCLGNPRGTKRGRVVVGNQGATTSKRLDAGLVNSAERLTMISEFEEEDERLAKETDKEGTVLGGKENNGLEGNGGATDMDEFITERRRQDIMRQRRIEWHISERLRIEDLPSQFEDWKNDCVICKVRHREETKHK